MRCRHNHRFDYKNITTVRILIRCKLCSLLTEQEQCSDLKHCRLGGCLMNNQNYWHSVRLEKSLCKGCTNCLKQCPTAAIRVQKGKAKILKERCIDCGECIRVCPYHAKAAVTDGLDKLNDYKYTIALVAPAFFGQFSKAEECNLILTALVGIGLHAAQRQSPSKRASS